jgi:hypothetical protein
VQQLGEQADLRERRAQLVRHARDEVGAHARQLLLPAELHQRHAGQPGGEREQRHEHRKARPRQPARDHARGDARVERHVDAQPP